MWIRAALAFALAAYAGSASAGSKVDLALVLAVDVSASIDASRYDLQRDGFARAFASDSVINAVASGEYQAIAVTLVEWSGPSNQKQVVPWTIINDGSSARAFGSAVAESPRAFADFTSISGAIDFSVALLHESGIDATRRVIDISGDGSNNSGRPVTEARAAALAAGITINGLAILASEPQLERYYQENVMGGDGAFVIAAVDFEAFSSAILQKLVREIAAVPTYRYNVASLP
jgi:hypothetical protein